MINIKTEYKTISQIEFETEKSLYYRAYDYARAMALTEFLRELEEKHGDEFKLVTASPKYFYNRSIKDTDKMEKTKAFGIGLWARWKVGDTYYYIQMNENPFFDAYISRSWKIDSKNMRHEYGGLQMNDTIYGNTNWDAEPETIIQLTKNMHKALSVTNKRQPNIYIKEIPAYERHEKQTIYIH